MSKATMHADDAVELYRLFESNDVKIWVDGGWAVDALLGAQTRSHDDLDIALQTKDLSKLCDLLTDRGYRPKGEKDAKPWNFVLTDDAGHEVDVHAFEFDSNGTGILGPLENGDFYPAASLTGIGTIDGQSVRCISVEWLIKFHTGYKLDENDIKDVLALCQKFGLEPLPEHANWQR
jgi:lincosamide nucleotidyltransferase A/C/D/E